MKRLPIRLRVTLIFAGVMAIVLAATGLFLYLRLESSLNHSVDQDLQTRSQQVIREMRVADKGIKEAARQVLDSRAEEFAQIVTPSGRVFQPSKQPAHHSTLTPGQAADAARDELAFERPSHGGDSESERFLARPFQFEGRTLVTVVGASLGDRNEALASLLRLLLIGGPIALLLASLAAYWTVGTALRPVEAMRRRAADVSASGSGRRLPVPPAQDELRRLGETLNQMLDRLETALERERSFVDDASHELRTPLAAHRAELELALRYGASEGELRAAIASAIEEADRLSQLSESLLVIARSDKGRLRLELEPIAITDLFATVHNRVGERAEREGRPLRFDEDSPVAIEGDRLRVEQALGNLVENALRHGDGTVHVWTRRENGRVQIHVSDEGHGFPPDFLPHAFERFRQADGARSGDGTGLGLAIVQAIAEAHGGHATARNAEEGGADVWIDLAVAARAGSVESPAPTPG